VLSQIGIAYGWLIFALYIFEPTREYTGKLTEVVLMPLSGLMSKMVTSLPTIVIAGASIAALIILVRFVGLYFESAARGETAIGWVSPDLAAATSLVVRFTIVVLFLVVAIPYITGTEDSSLARVGLVAIVSLGLAATPLLASMCVGIAVVYGRGLHPGDFVNFGPHAGRIESISLLELRLRDAHGCELRVPHLLCLFYPLRVPGQSRPVTATVTVDSKAPQPAVRQLLLEVAAAIGTEPELEFIALDQGGASYRVTVRSGLLDAQHRLYCAIGDALADRSIPLGTAPKP
jgi:small-conductance mechanosensitive channel